MVMINNTSAHASFLPHQILEGKTWHVRHTPSKHTFDYPYRYWGMSLNRLAAGDFPQNSSLLLQLGRLFSVSGKGLHNFNFSDYVDAEKLDETNATNASYKKKVANKIKSTLTHKRKNQHKSKTDYIDAAKKWLDHVNQEFNRLTGSKPKGDVLALVVGRNLGFYFSPVNFYVGFDTAGNASHLLAEVSNTPWNKRHFYGFTLDGNKSEFSHNKDFHVSPFNPVDQVYTWRVNIKNGETGLKNINLSINVSDERGKVFAAGINMHAMPMNQKELRRTIVKNPVMNYSSVGRIYWHALLLYLFKKVPYVGYNQKLKDSKQQ